MQDEHNTALVPFMFVPAKKTLLLVFLCENPSVYVLSAAVARAVGDDPHSRLEGGHWFEEASRFIAFVYLNLMVHELLCTCMLL